MTHLLVTNDFPPKTGGIQAYLWELWRRLDPDSFVVLTASSHPDAAAFDRAQATRGFRIERTGRPLLLPTPQLVRRVRETARRVGADLVVLDPVLPLGLIGPHLGIPYAVIVHGAEVAVPGRLPGGRRLVARVLRNSVLVVSAGRYPSTEAMRTMRPGARLHLGPRALGKVTTGRHADHRPNHAGASLPRSEPSVVEIPPGVDLDRFRPAGPSERQAARAHFGLPVDGPLVVSVSRLVPRKGMDVLIDAAVRLHADIPDLTVAISGTGRDAERLAGRIAEYSAPVRLLGAVSDRDLPRLIAAADVFVMLCRNRWLGLEQEGFGIVFLEAAASAVPQVGGYSGGADEAVVDGETGIVVRRPADAGAAARAIAGLLADQGLRERMGSASRRRAEGSFDYDKLAPRLATSLADVAWKAEGLPGLPGLPGQTD